MANACRCVITSEPFHVSGNVADVHVGRAMLHLRDTLPKLLESGHASSELFPTDIYSSNIILKLHAPLPIRVSSLCMTYKYDGPQLISDHFTIRILCRILDS
jgi:hypothetical protein